MSSAPVTIHPVVPTIPTCVVSKVCPDAENSSGRPPVALMVDEDLFDEMDPMEMLDEL